MKDRELEPELKMKHYLSLVTFLLLAVLGTRLPVNHLRVNFASLYLNNAISEKASPTDLRVVQVRSAKALMKISTFSIESPRFADQLAINDSNLTLKDILSLGDHVFLRLDQALPARQWYAHAVRTFPESSAAWYKLATVDEHLGRILESEKAYRESIRLGSMPELGVGASDSYCKLGALQREHEVIRNLQHAQMNLESGLRINDFGSPSIESECYFELGNTRRWQSAPHAEFIGFYHRAVSADNTNVMALIMLGVTTFEMTHDLDEGKQYILRSLAIRPTVRAYQELAKMHEFQGDNDGAIYYYKQALAVAETNQAVPAIEAEITRLQTEQDTPENGIEH